MEPELGMKTTAGSFALLDAVAKEASPRQQSDSMYEYQLMLFDRVGCICV